MRRVRVRKTMPGNLRLLGALSAVVCVAALVTAAPAGASTVQVSGLQTVVDPVAGTFEMEGSLIGTWYTLSFEVRGLHPSGTIQATGTELFVGCLDLDADGACAAGDPSGTLSLEMKFSGKFVLPDFLVELHGRCQHPIVSGTDGFADATGVIHFKDIPPGGIATYTGHISL
jgi:hypothetical protein